MNRQYNLVVADFIVATHGSARSSSQFSHCVLPFRAVLFCWILLRVENDGATRKNCQKL